MPYRAYCIYRPMFPIERARARDCARRAAIYRNYFEDCSLSQDCEDCCVLPATEYSTLV